MKKMFKLVLCGLIGVSLTACSSNGGTSNIDPMETYGCDTLQVYNWGEYVGENVIANFEDEYNVKISYSLFGSNEEMYTKLLGNANYDILIPSDYMVERLIEEDMVQPLDLSLIPNMELLYDGIPNLAFDEGNEYSVPYFWGTVGIVYDSTIIDPADVESMGYEIFRSEKYAGEDIVVYDSERDSFMMALKALGYSMNTENIDEIEEAYEWLVDVDQTLNPSYLQDEVIDGMINGEFAMANVYSGDAAYMLSENENLAFFTPNEGTNYWVDSIVIPKASECSALAHEFINYTLSYDAAFDNSNYVGYSSPNAEVLEELSAEGGYYEGNEAYKPNTDNPLNEGFRHNEAQKKELADRWIRVKNQ